MDISKEQAAKQACEYVKEIVAEHFKDCMPLDNLPSFNSAYLPRSWKESNYWLFPYPCLQPKNHFQTGGDSVFLAVSKKTGEVTTITVPGE